MYKKSKNLIDSFNYAIKGLIYAFKTQRNMKIHISISIVVLLASLFMDLKKNEIILLFVTISLVIAAELLNTAVEAVVDILCKDYHPKAEVAKNVAAGSVLVTSINAIFVGYLLFFERLNISVNNIINKVTNSPAHITFITLIIVSFAVIILKSRSKKGTFLKGGMPSGHSAIAFSVVIIISFIVKNTLIISLSILLAILVVQSRIESGIHNVYEVIAGAVLGTLITTLIFQIFT